MLNQKLRGCYGYYGVKGNFGSLQNFFYEVGWSGGHDLSEDASAEIGTEEVPAKFQVCGMGEVTDCSLEYLNVS